MEREEERERQTDSCSLSPEHREGGRMGHTSRRWVPFPTEAAAVGRIRPVGCSRGGPGPPLVPTHSILGGLRLACVHVRLHWAVRRVPGGGNVLRIVSAHTQDNPHKAAGTGLLALRLAWHRGARQCLRHWNQAKVCLRLTQTRPGSAFQRQQTNREGARSRSQRPPRETVRHRQGDQQVTIRVAGVKNRVFRGAEGMGPSPTARQVPPRQGGGQR